MKYVIFFTALVLGLGCRKDAVISAPGCIKAKIEALKSQPAGYRGYSVHSYDYNGKKVYYFPPHDCCDRFSDLYDENCELICHPDGGFGGVGDGACHDFFTARQHEVLIWKDNRQ